MDVMQAIHARHAIRAYEDEPVSREQIEVLIEAAAAAPSSHNSQPWRLHIAIGRERRARVNQVVSQSTVHLSEYLEVLPEEQRTWVERFFADLGNAPVVMAVSLPNPTDPLDELNEFISAGAMIENILLAATDMGLGSCNITFSFWVRDQLLEVFEVPEGRTIVSLILLGHPAEQPASPRHREDIANIVE